MVITYYYIGLFHYYLVITYYVINSHYYLLLTVELADEGVCIFPVEVFSSRYSTHVIANNG